MIKPESHEELIIQFRNWLILNRSYLHRKLQKYNAIRYYIVTMSIGCGVFAVNSAFEDPSNIFWSIPAALIFVLVIIFSHRISGYFSGIKELKELPIYKSESRFHWIQELSEITGASHSLLDDFNVAKEIKHSKKEHICIPVFFNAMICIADAVKDVGNAPKVI